MYRDAIVLTGVLIGIAGVTQTPFGYPVIALFWVLLGAGLQAALVRQADARPVTVLASPGAGASVARSGGTRSSARTSRFRVRHPG
jgi:hypothetical protein